MKSTVTRASRPYSLCGRDGRATPALILILTTLLLVPPAFSQTLPASSIPTVPKDFESGLKVSMEAIKELGVVDDPDKIRRLNEIGYRLAQRAAPGMPYFSFHIVKMEEPNAFALPGGFIFVTSGMLDLDLTDDEMAALVGHEITHVTRDHIHKMSKRQTLVNLLYEALVFGVAFGIRDNGSRINSATGLPSTSSKSEILQGSAAFGALFQDLLLRGFSREFEMEADQGGMIAAAGAGFSTKGTSQLFEKMRQRIYEAPGYGYLRTHPYFEDRVAAARVQSSMLETSKNPPDSKGYRKLTQQTFLQALPNEKDEDAKRELRHMALNACPTGKTAEDLRSWFIHEAENKEKTKEPFYRDYGKLIKIYEQNIDEVKKDDPTSDFITKLQRSLDKIKKDRDATLPLYEEVLAKQAFDTEMLQRFISNFPQSPRLPEVQFRLAENYRILKKQRDAVDLYLAIFKNQADSEWRKRSRQSMLQILPQLDDLSSCYKISVQSKDPELEKLAQNRMTVLSASFGSLQNGYDFRRSYPASNYEQPVLARMGRLASQTLNQGRLYQAIGEYQKALDQYNQILRYCPDLPVADQVKETIVDFQELQSAKS